MAKPDWAIASSTNVLPRADSSAMFELPEQVPCVGAGTLVFADIPRFWQAYDAAQGLEHQARVATFQRLYLDKASPGLAAFVKARIEGAEDLVAAIDQHPRYYAQLRPQQGMLAKLAPELCAAQRGLTKYLPKAKLPPVYFLIGRMNSGGTVDTAGLLIGTEMYGRLPDTPLTELGDWHRSVLSAPEQVPHIVAHELVHTQQGFDESVKPTLLAAAIREGSADFLAELSSGRHINQVAHEWAEPRAKELWQAFQVAMNGEDFSGWLYDTSQVPKRPADLGYWMGYRISCAFYRRAADKAQALNTLLELKDPEAVLTGSQVGRDFESNDAACISPAKLVP